MKKSNVAFLVGGVFVGLAIMGYLGKLDVTAEQRDAQTYCENVRDGVWPHFKGGDFAVVCPGYAQGTYKE